MQNSITLAPPDMSDRIPQVKRWALHVLTGASMEYPGPRIPMYYRGALVVIMPGSWQLVASSNSLYVGSLPSERALESYGDFSYLDRIAIIGAIASFLKFAGDSEFLEAYTTAISKALIHGYQTAVSGLLETSVPDPVLQLAFNDTQVAARMGDEWILPTGEPVDVEGNWTVVSV